MKSPLFNNLPQDMHRYWPVKRPARSAEGELTPTSEPPTASLRLCPCTPQSAFLVWAARDVHGGLDPWTQVERPALCSETPTSDETLACGHSRSEIRLNRSLHGAHASQAEIGRNDWAAPEPVTGWNSLR